MKFTMTFFLTLIVVVFSSNLLAQNRASTTSRTPQETVQQVDNTIEQSEQENKTETPAPQPSSRTETPAPQPPSRTATPAPQPPSRTETPAPQPPSRTTTPAPPPNNRVEVQPTPPPSRIETQPTPPPSRTPTQLPPIENRTPAQLNDQVPIDSRTPVDQPSRTRPQVNATPETQLNIDLPQTDMRIDHNDLIDMGRDVRLPTPSANNGHFSYGFLDRSNNNFWEGPQDQERLHLTESQQRLMIAIDLEFQLSLFDLQKDLARVVAERKFATLDDNYFMLRNYTEQEIKIESDIAKLRIDYSERVYFLLTPEQRNFWRDSRIIRGLGIYRYDEVLLWQ